MKGNGKLRKKYCKIKWKNPQKINLRHKKYRKSIPNTLIAQSNLRFLSVYYRYQQIN